MIKRRFYKDEHADRNDVSDSSSSSDDESDSTKEDEEEEEEETIVVEKPNSPTLGSGYESEDSSGNEVDCDSSGLMLNEDDEDTVKDGQSSEDRSLTGKGHAESAAGKRSTDAVKAFNAKDTTQADFDDYVLKCKSVFKCRLCPRIVCLTEDTIKAHFNSKRHARSKKLLGEGRLKFMLNSDGEIEEDQETHAERHARIVALAENLTHQKKKNKGRQRQRERLKKRLRDASKEGKASESMKKPTKKKRKI
eukprot:TRINITY_DN1284_c1_g3_i4.p1 TRINITY_DN1284_c1_g3~~TRINITY_DN1284_c1_g3_i4.p1  ORF type:complete len:250 (-),score=75.73 TRINITY_DN1284_c1_g3_i4:459-1208(-)